MACLSKKIRAAPSPSHAEVLGILHCLYWAIDVRLPLDLIESNSLPAVNLINCSIVNLSNWVIFISISFIFHLILWEFVLVMYTVMIILLGIVI